MTSSPDAPDGSYRALRESDERYRAFVANSSEGIWRFELEEPVPIDLPPDEQVDRFYQFAYLAECNDIVAGMYGFAAAEELIGVRLGDMLVREDPANLEYLCAFIESGYRLIGAESREIDRDGNEKHFVNNLIGVVENGVVLRAWGTQRDVTEQRAIIAALEQANRAKDEFLAMLSHELRTPMTATLGWATMLQTGVLDAESTRTAADAIMQATRAQAHLIDDLLDISRIVSGKMRLAVEPVRVAQVIAAAVETIRSAAVAKNIELDVDANEDVELQADPERLQQVFWNLVSNAVKFTPRGGRVSVALRREGDVARVIVRDTGEGIDAEVLPFIFERFRQADTGASRKFGGLGLGLSIARNLVELHGGTLTASSEGRGHGAELVVTLPVTAPGAPAAKAVEAKPALRPLDGLSLLVVEDDDRTRVMLETALRNFGAKVTSAANADEALAVLESRHFDLLVSDIGLAGEDGCAMLARIRETREGLRAIAVTAYASPAERDRALAAGFERWLPKPIDPMALAEEIRRLIF
ncbi:MAG TPA: ATP-binding protein [Thermoanaerobaculia bacterium]|nr:ATP-binding protein [Thermoanaerobaculia bacterium]